MITLEAKIALTCPALIRTTDWVIWSHRKTNGKAKDKTLKENRLKMWYIGSKTLVLTIRWRKETKTKQNTYTKNKVSSKEVIKAQDLR